MLGIAVVADAGATAGLGHLGRCTAIAAGLRAREVPAACHALGADAPRTIDGIEWLPIASLESVDADVVLLDSYEAPRADVEALAARCTLAVMHDAGDPPAGVALVIGIGAPGEAAGAEWLSGLAFAPLRAPFWGLPPRTPAADVRRVLVTTGGGVLPEAAVAAAEAARAALPGAAIRLVRGPLATFDAPPGAVLVYAPGGLLEELLAADLVVSAAGQTALEAAAAGAPCVAVALVENQRANAGALAAAGAAVVVEPASIPGALTALAADLEARAALVLRAQAAVDGYGALRIAFRLEQLVRASLSGRDAAA
jgi:spore coat polysaccharide biosynthesis predicted glycosyltransferase SpsG